MSSILESFGQFVMAFMAHVSLLLVLICCLRLIHSDGEEARQRLDGMANGITTRQDL